MKYKIIASIVIVLIIIVALVLKSGSSTQQVDENGNPIENVQQYQE